MKRLQQISIFALCAAFSVSSLMTAHKQDHLKEEERHQERIDSAKAGILGRLLAGIVVGGTIAGISRTESLKNTALGTGLLVSSIPVFIGTISADKETRKACYSMAIAAPVIAAIGGILVSNPVYTKGGLLDRATIVNGDKLAEIIRDNPPAQPVAALVALGAVSAYIPVKSSLDRLSNYLIKKGSQAYDYVTGQ